MHTLFIDLDNTLIYSYKRNTTDASIRRVEMYDGKPLSFITTRSYDTLCELLQYDDLQIVPTTTRDYTQFKRLELPKTEYAIIGNGSNLLINGIEDPVWHTESKNYFNCCCGTLMHICRRVNNLHKDGRLTLRDGMFLCGKYKNPDAVVATIKAMLPYRGISVLLQGSKVYVLPEQFDKGNAIERFKKRFDTGAILSAGDNKLDFPMARHSAVFITSNRECKEKNAKVFDTPIFSDDILNCVTHYVKGEKLCL